MASRSNISRRASRAAVGEEAGDQDVEEAERTECRDDGRYEGQGQRADGRASR